MALPVNFPSQSQSGFGYRHVYSRNMQPFLTGAEVRELVQGFQIPSRTIRWKFETKFKRKVSGHKDVLLKHMLEACLTHKIEPVTITNPVNIGPGQYVDVLFANGEDMMKAWNVQLSFDFYGTQPSLIGRGSKLGSDMIGLEIMTLPAQTKMSTLVDKLFQDNRLRQAGEIIDVWATETASTRKFNGRVLVLFQINSVSGVPSVTARTKIPGFFVMNDTAYHVKFPERPGWCKICCRDDASSFHSIHACPKSKCLTCHQANHSSVDCSFKRSEKQVAVEQQVPEKQTCNEQGSPQEARIDTPPEQQCDESQDFQPQISTKETNDQEFGQQLPSKKKKKGVFQKKRRIAEAQTPNEQVFSEQANEVQIMNHILTKEHVSDDQRSEAQVTEGRTCNKEIVGRKTSEIEAREQPVLKKQISKGQASEAKAPENDSSEKTVKAQASKFPVSRPQKQKQKPQVPESLPKKQLQYIKAMERRLLRLCLEDENADVSKLASAFTIIALSSDDDDSEC